VRVGAEHETAREGVVLQHDLVDDAGPGCQKPIPNLALAERRNSNTSRFSCKAAVRSDEAPTRA